MTKIIGFLQNRYLREGLQKHPAFLKPGAMDNRTPYGQRLWDRMLYTSQSGQRLFKHLGEEIYGQIVWDNASPEIGGISSSSFPAQPDYMARCLREEGFPSVILIFGNVAWGGIGPALNQVCRDRADYRPTVLRAPHPTARPYPGAALDVLRQAIDRALAIQNDPSPSQAARCRHDVRRHGSHRPG